MIDPTPPTGEPIARLVQLSDTHLTAGRTLLHGGIDSDANLATAFDRIAACEVGFDAVIASGDLSDDGSPDSYRRLRRVFDEQAARLGCPVLPGMGNHDVRAPFASILLDRPTGPAPIDYVTWVGGLRIVNLDSAVPGAGHGELTIDQLDWLGEVLAAPSASGTVLVVHHPPARAPARLMRHYDLVNPDDLARTLGGSDVRLIVSGHWHTATTTALEGVPVCVAGAVGYAADPLEFDGHRGMTAGQCFAVIEVFADRVLVTSVPLVAHPTLFAAQPATD